MNEKKSGVLIIASLVFFIIGAIQLYRDNFSQYSFGYLFIIGCPFVLGAVFGYNLKEMEK